MSTQDSITADKAANIAAFEKIMDIEHNHPKVEFVADTLRRINERLVGRFLRLEICEPFDDDTVLRRYHIVDGPEGPTKTGQHLGLHELMIHLNGIEYALGL